MPNAPGVESLLRHRRASVLALIAAAAALPSALVHVLGAEGEAPISGTWHLVGMAVACGAAAAAAFALVLHGARTGDGRSIVVGGAFGAMSALLLVHALATPGVLVGPNGLVALTAGLALPVGGTLLAASALPAAERPRRPWRLAAVMGGIALAVLVAGLAVLADPALVPAVPRARSTAAWVLLGAGLLPFALLATRAARTWLLTRRPADLAVLTGTTWLGVALVPTLVLTQGTWAWWMGHVLEISGVALVGVPVALDLHRGGRSRPLSGDLRPAELVASEEHFLGPRVRALMVRLAEKDGSTEGHTRRVATLAVEVGEALGLGPARLRELAIGGLLHDMGKLATPDAVLRKPGPLDDEEHAIIRRHPADGDELLAGLGFGARVRAMVRGHHERLDGGGYPDGVAAGELALETRILTVCDVFDALVSPRVYRPAWPRDRALELLRDGAGTAFDPVCVDALERLVAPRPPVAAVA